MTNYFDYADLTWPDIARLPRDLPLIIPLGDGYNLDWLSSALGNPAQAGLLPPFPYGWEGSAVSVPEEVLVAYLANLLNSLRDDGFTRVYALTPPGVAAGLGSARIALRSERTSSQGQVLLLEDDPGKRVVLIPVGHTEQHGFHLPMNTDTLIIDAIARGSAGNAGGKAINLPVIPYGVSTHRAAFAGTLNAGGRAFEDFWISVIDTLVLRGFDRFYLISGHGGNCSFLVNAVKYIGERHRRAFCATSWLYLSGPQGIEALQKYRRSTIGGMGHAGELETSLILHLRPDLVHMDRVVDETDFIATPSYYMDWVEGGALVANPPWDDDTATGAYGAGSLATAEHGKLWLEAAIAEKITHIEEIHEQQKRREARRKSGFGLWGDQSIP